MAQRATQWHIRSKKRNIDIQLPVLISVEKQHPVLKWELISSATEVKEPMILDNSPSFFLHYCYYYYCYNDLSWVKRFPSIQISE